LSSNENKRNPDCVAIKTLSRGSSMKASWRPLQNVEAGNSERNWSRNESVWELKLKVQKRTLFPIVMIALEKVVKCEFDSQLLM
jgi:hypothetical protein